MRSPAPTQAKTRGRAEIPADLLDLVAPTSKDTKVRILIFLALACHGWRLVAAMSLQVPEERARWKFQMKDEKWADCDPAVDQVETQFTEMEA